MTITQLRKVDWRQLVNRREALLMTSITTQAMSSFSKVAKLPWECRYRLHLSSGEILHSAKELETLRDIFRSGGIRAFDGFQHRLVREVGALDRLSARLGRLDFSQLTRSELRSALDNFFATALRAQNFLTPVAASEKVLSQAIMERLPTAYPEQQQRWLAVLTAAQEENEHAREEKAFYRLAAACQRNRQDCAELIEQHVQQFGWIGARWYRWEHVWTAADIRARLDVFCQMHRDPRQALRQLTRAQQERATASRKLLQQLRIGQGKPLRHFIELAQRYAYLRTWRTDVIYRAGFRIRELLWAAARQSHFPPERVTSLTVDEVLRMLRNWRPPVTAAELMRRQEFFANCLIGDEQVVLSGRAWQRRLQALLPEVEPGTEIKGVTAYPGVARGTVRIVRTVDDLTKVRPGDVLVAVMTFPHFIAAMERASAFVTDEGGILCHAAIVAREMKKPCVIGTKVATQSIKDGEMVEVDATKGVVKKLKMKNG